MVTAKSQPDRHIKTWGYEDWIANDPIHGYCGKILFVAHCKRCSMHFHLKKHETFYVLEGEVRMGIIEADSTYREIDMQVGDTLIVPPGLMHQFTGLTDSKILEVSSLHSETDSYRVYR